MPSNKNKFFSDLPINRYINERTHIVKPTVNPVK